MAVEGAESIAARSASKADNVTVYRVDDLAFEPRIRADGTVPVVQTRKGRRALAVHQASISPRRAGEFARTNRAGNATVTAVSVPRSYADELARTAVHDLAPAAAANPAAPLVVDVTKAPGQYGLRTPEHIQAFRDAIVPGSARVVDPDTLR